MLQNGNIMISNSNLNDNVMISNFNPYPGFLNHATKWQCHDFQFQSKRQCHDFQFQSNDNVMIFNKL